MVTILNRVGKQSIAIRPWQFPPGSVAPPHRSAIDAVTLGRLTQSPPALHARPPPAVGAGSSAPRAWSAVLQHIFTETHCRPMFCGNFVTGPYSSPPMSFLGGGTFVLSLSDLCFPFPV
eukprot:EG_transcript_16183